MKMNSAGYEIRHGKYLAFRHPDQKHFTNVKSLGSYYTEENLLNRLEKNRHETRLPRNASREVCLFIEMSTFIADNNRSGFDRWAKLHDLKESAKTFNYLSEHNLLNYEDFLQHYSDTENAKVESAKAIKKSSKFIEHQQLIQKKCNSYRICRDIISNEKNAPDKNKYQQQHAAEYRLHDILLQELTDLGITKLPSAAKLKTQLDSLKKEKAILQNESQKLDQQLQVLSIIKTNFETMLSGSRSTPSRKIEENHQNPVSILHDQIL